MARMICYHSHPHTCVRKDSKECHLVFKRGRCENTCVVQLDPAYVDHDNAKCDLGYVEPPIVALVTDGLDDRLLVWELRRNGLESLPLLDAEIIIKEKKSWILNTFKESIGVELLEESSQLFEVLLAMDGKELDAVYNYIAGNLVSRNQYVVEHNPLVTALTGSNTNAAMLRNTKQSKSVLII